MNYDILPQTITLLGAGMLVLFLFMGLLFVSIHLFVFIARKLK